MLLSTSTITCSLNNPRPGVRRCLRSSPMIAGRSPPPRCPLYSLTSYTAQRCRENDVTKRHQRSNSQWSPDGNNSGSAGGRAGVGRKFKHRSTNGRDGADEESKLVTPYAFSARGLISPMTAFTGPSLPPHQPKASRNIVSGIQGGLGRSSHRIVCKHQHESGTYRHCTPGRESASG